MNNKLVGSYYLLLPGETNEDLMFEDNLLGEIDIRNKFWPAQGLSMLMNIATTKEEMLPHIKIVTDKGVQYTVEKFLELLQKVEIKANLV
jgi:hypothetical protein